MFKLRTLGLSPFLTGTLLCASALHADIALAGWTNTSSSTPSLLTAASGATIYAADLAAIYTSSDGGATWSSSSSAPGAPYTALSYVNNALWLGTDKSGTAYSTNGSSWTVASTGQGVPIFNVPPVKIQAIAATGSSTLLAGNVSGLYRSTDNGATWSSNVSGLPQTASGPFSVGASINALTATSAGTAVAATAAGIYRSSDGGATWTSAGLSGTAVKTVLALPGTTTLYALASGLYKSSDDGKTWTAVSSWSFGTPTALAAHPTDGVTVFVGDSSGSVRSSADGGSTWTQLGGAAATSGSILALAVPASDATSLVAATANGIYQYTSGPTIGGLTINPISGVQPSTDVASDEIVITGLTAPTAISIVGGSYSVNGGSYTQASGLVTNGARVNIKLTSSSSYNTPVSATLTVGKASGKFTVTTVKKTLITAPTDLLSTTPPNVTVSNGSLVVSGSTTLNLKPNASPDIQVLIPQNVPTTINSGSNTYTITPITTNSTFTTQNVLSGGSSVPGLSLTTGSASIQLTQSPNTPQTIPLYTPGSGGTINIPSGSGSLNFSIGIVPPSLQGLLGTGSLPSLGIPSTVSTPFTITGLTLSPSADKANRFAAGGVSVYGGETLDLNNQGQIKQIRIGSLNGDQGQAGDPLTLANVDSNVAVPKLSGNLPRLGTTLVDLAKSALDSQFGASGSATYDATTGILTYVVNGKTYRFIPVGSPLVQAATAAASNLFTATNAANTASGTFSLVNRGVQLTLSSTLGYFTDFDKALKAIDPTAKFTLKSSGFLKINIGSSVAYVSPSSAITTANATTPTIGIDSNNKFTFQDSAGGVQTLYPVFADLSVLDQTLKSIDPKANTSYNGNGTTAVTLINAPYTFNPEYLLTPVPSSHSNDLWWVDGGKIFIRYPDSTAQAFSL
jgi:hypothetical protein